MLKSLNRHIQCKKEAKVDYYAINNTKFTSRLKKIVNVGERPIHEIGELRVKNQISFPVSDRPSPSFEVCSSYWKRDVGQRIKLNDIII